MSLHPPARHESARPTGVALVGCGNIALPYARDLARYPEIALTAVWDRHPGRADALAREMGTRAASTLDELLADDATSIVVNLTGHASHHEVTRQILAAGRHVHSEKPLALTPAEARDLVDFARARGVRLSCAPANFLGEAAMTAAWTLAQGDLGKIRLIYAEANWGRIEDWHPSPAGFYQVGPLYDVGVYPITLAAVLLGPVRRVTAWGTVLHPQRLTRDGTPFTVLGDDLTVAVLEFADGVRMRLTCNFYVPSGHTAQRGMEFHGDAGSLYLADWQQFDAKVEFAPYAGERTPVPFVTGPFPGIEWGRSVRLLARAISERRPHATTGELAAHVVDVLDAIRRSGEEERPVEVDSGFAPLALAMP
ncbi:Gfo/Idh/MocA family protein [Streptomyces longwoodensis]|uniref:Gfo/Idh/MocA family protein n=1 Tax=Streptomyces longwoodensis TaxID=68231 RepID=UPI0033F6C080